MDARTRELEAKVAALEGQPGADRAAESIEGGYEDVSITANVKGTQLRVMVNGRTVATYDQNVRVYLGQMGVLRRGFVNNITFAYSSAAEGNYVQLRVLPQGGDSGAWQEVFNFAPKGSKLEDRFEVPFAGKMLAEDKDPQRTNRPARPLPASLNHNETLVRDVE